MKIPTLKLDKVTRSKELQRVIIISLILAIFVRFNYLDQKAFWYDETW